MDDESAASEVASRFLAAQAALDVERARPLAHAGFVVTSPGGRETGLDALFGRLRSAYRTLEKRPAGRDVAACGGAWAVYTYGTMVGERTDGTAFEGVRFLDRIVVRDGRVERQDIWNDFGQPAAR